MLELGGLQCQSIRKRLLEKKKLTLEEALT